MAFITLSGTLLDPTSELAVGDQVRFTHKSTTGETVQSAVSLLTIPPTGDYSIDLQYGLVLVEYKDVRKSQFKNLGVATVNQDNPATSIPELLNALVPVSSAELIEFQAILADCVAAQLAAEAAQLAAENAATTAEAFAYQLTTVDLIASTAIFTTDTNIPTSGFTTSGDGGGCSWVQNGITGQTPSQSPTQLSNNLINDANGNQWALVVGQVLDYNGVQWFPSPFGDSGNGGYLFDTNGWVYISLINDLSQSYTFPTVAAYKASTIVFPVGKTIHLDDRDADFKVIAGTLTGNDKGIIASTEVDQSISYAGDDKIFAEHFGWPISEAGATMNAATTFASANGHSRVYYATPCLNQTTTILIRTNMVIVGPSSGVEGEIRVLDGEPATLVQVETENFLNDIITDPIETSAGLKADCGFENVFLNGNKANRAGVITDWKEGAGFRAYWIRPYIKNVRIHGATGLGFYSQYDRGTIVDFPSKVNTDTIEGFIDELVIHDTVYENFVFQGPSDIRIDRMYAGWPANGLFDTVYDPLKVSLKFPTKTIDAVVFNKFGVDSGYIHAFGNPHGRGIVVKNNIDSDQVRIKGETWIGESCFGNVFLDVEARAQINGLDTHNNTGGDGTRPHFDDSSTSGTIVTNFEVFRGGTENGANSAELNGNQTTISALNIYGKARAGHGVVFNGAANIVSAGNIDGCQGNNHNAEVSAGIVTRSGALNNAFNGIVNACDKIWVHEGTSRVGQFNMTARFNATATLQGGLENIPSDEWAANCSITHFNSGATADDQGALRNKSSFDNTITTEQTINIAHKLIRTPNKEDVLTSFANNSGFVNSMDYIRVNAITPTNIDVRVKVGVIGSGTSFLTTSVY